MTGVPRISIPTLPDLQTLLDALGAGQDLRLSSRDCHRLFGIDDALKGRVRNFARGHGCFAVWDELGLTFHRLHRPEDGSATGAPPSRF